MCALACVCVHIVITWPVPSFVYIRGFFSKLMALFHSFWNKEEIKKCIHTKARRINVIPFQLQLFESREIWSSKLRTFLSARIANHISDIDMPPVACRCTRHCHRDKIKGFLCGYTRIQLLKYTCCWVFVCTRPCCHEGIYFIYIISWRRWTGV